MMARRIGSMMLATAAAVMFVSLEMMTGVAQAQTAAEVKCINGVNNASSKVGKTVGKNTAKCVGDATKSKIADADVCIDGDPKGKIGKATGKVDTIDGKLCSGAGVSPPFGFTGAATAKQAPQDKERALVRDIFGANVQASLATNGFTTSKCQAAVIKAVEKLSATVGKDFVKCKKTGFKDATITSNAGLEACVGANLKDKIGKAKLKVDKILDKKCFVNFDTAFGGDCPGPKSAFGACVKAKAVGRTCEAINAVDGLNVGCDLVDDGSLNGTSIQCNNSIVEAGETCDDGNNIDDGNGCDAACQRNDVCGDGVIQSLFETCDDAGESATCDADCTAVACGDGTLNTTAGEVCDDGTNNNTGEGFCIADCSAVQTCGDGIQNGTEQCDDGNLIDGDGCSSTCMLAQNAQCPDFSKLQFFAKVTRTACTTNADCSAAGNPGSCDTGLGVCTTVSGLDTGWTGIAHGADVLDGGFIAGDVLCPGGSLGGPPGPCGECVVTGVDPSTRNCRCSNDTQAVCHNTFDFDGTDCGTGVTCTTDSDCKFCTGDSSVKCNINSDCAVAGGICSGGSPTLTCNTNSGMCEGTCNCYLGTTLPLSSGNVPACVVNQFAKDVTGTANVDSGSSLLTVNLRSIVFLSTSGVQPCQVCGGTCSAPAGGKCKLPTVNRGNPCVVNSDCDDPPGAGNGACGSTFGKSCFVNTDCDINSGDFDGVCGGFDVTANDGIKDGTCFGGDFDGTACDIDGFSTTFPALPGQNGGGQSLDCFPSNGSNISGTGLKLTLNTTTGSASLGANANCGGLLTAYNCFCRVCSGDLSLPCNSDAECAAVGAGTCSKNGNGGALAKPNGCDPNGTGGDGNVGSCVEVPGSGGVLGECADSGDENFFCDGVVRGDGTGFVKCDQVNRECSDDKPGAFSPPTACLADSDCKRCSIADTPCVANTDCPGGETCIATGVTCEYTDCKGGLPQSFGKFDRGRCTLSERKKCFLDPILVSGVADPNAPVGAAAFCIPPTINQGLNGVVGLPGPARTKLQVTTEPRCGGAGGTVYTPGTLCP